MNALKKFLPDLLAVALFVVISFAYFFPATFQGRILYQHDSSAGRGAGQEASEYYERTGERTRWTNSTFCGMPTYQTAPSYDSTTGLAQAVKAYHLWLPENVWYVFVYLLGFYILLRSFDFRHYLAALGALVWAFSSYFFIIIAAGHIWKVMALAYLPPMIAGLVLAYRGRLLPGFIVTAIFTAFEVSANHVQMTYYYLIVILLMVVAFGIEAVRKKQLRSFWKASAVCLVAALIGVLFNISNLYHTWQYQKESMRGKSELVKPSSANQTDSGLERDYITHWSYGIDETWTLLVPNTKGGASVPLAASERAMEKANSDFMPIYQQIGQYWGEQPGTSGPVYVGAFVLFLFVLGLFIVKGPMKWALLLATILSVLLSWGKNFMPLTDFFIDYVPLYSKFRTVASILVVAEFTIPLLAMLALKELVESPDLLRNNRKWVGLSFALTAGMAVLFALMPSVFFSDFISSAELAGLSQLPAEYLNPIKNNLREMRMAVFTADCWRSFWIIAVGVGLLVLYAMRKLSAPYMVSALFVLCLADMWTVNKRYLNDEMFVDKMQREQPIQKTAADEQILMDRSLYYRVLNLASNTFNENETSYYHKSLGGYHAAKLRRYQELTERYLVAEMQKIMPVIADVQGDMTRVPGDSLYPVINMLNAKYFILPLTGDQRTVPLQNPYAYGNAWFVDRIYYADNANEELDMLGKINLRRAAVADRRFESVLGQAKPSEGQNEVELTDYEPNRLRYTVNTEQGGLLVFSEIYYPGWTALVDGQEVPLGRVNYVLRALQMKPGKHVVELNFYPKSIKKTETVAYAAYAVLLLSLLFLLFRTWKRHSQKGVAQ